MNQLDAIALMIRLEGGYSARSDDPGGATKYGITQRTLDSVRPRLPPLPASVADIETVQATAIYQTIQWHDIAGDSLPVPLAVCMLNSAINQGTPTAVKILQTILGVRPDGLMGPGTLAALAAWHSPYMPEQTLAEEFCAHVAAHYAFLNGAESQFELGWFRRLFRVYTAALL